MHHKQKTKSKCEKRYVRIPKSRPLHEFIICDTIKHFKEAYAIKKQSTQYWACQGRLSSILQINAHTELIRARLDKCSCK